MCLPSFLEFFVRVTLGGNGLIPSAANGGPAPKLWLCWWLVTLLLITNTTVSPESLKTCTAVA